ncbi:MAG: COG4315 family predicted lipoprotein [Solirubrobacteraceae bacterium]
MVVVAVIATMGLVACGSSSSKKSPSATAAAAPATSAATTPATSAGTGVTAIGSRKTQDGTLIIGAGDRTVYFFRPDKRSTTGHAKQSTCYNGCAAVWPPVLATRIPATSGKAEASLLGLTTRKDGTKQVTHNGLPLYYYVPDTKAGQVTGNQLKDQFGFWAGLQPSGKMSASG